MPTLEERVEQLEADLPTRRGYVVELQSLRQGQQLLLQRVDSLEGDMAEVKSDLAEVKSDVAGLKTDVAGLKSDFAEVKSDLKLILQHFKIET